MLIESATSFATIVSLISEFRNINKVVADDDHQRFLEWLSENRHDEIKKIIEQNQATLISIKTILNQDYVVITQRLNSIDSNLAILLSGDKVFSGLVKAINPDSLISEQQLSILIQFENSGASRLLGYKMLHGSGYTFVDGNSEELEFNEPRFIEDDFSKLVELGLLRLEFGLKGDAQYIYTRLASNFVKESLI